MEGLTLSFFIIMRKFKWYASLKVPGSMSIKNHAHVPFVAGDVNHVPDGVMAQSYVSTCYLPTASL